MPLNFRHLPVLIFAVCLPWGCSGDRSIAPSASGVEEQTDQSLGKLATGGVTTRAIVLATVKQDGVPLGGVTVALSRSVSGRTPDVTFSDTTDANGRVRADVHLAAGGYYSARATRAGSPLGSWFSIPINGGQKVTVELPVGETARVTDTSTLTSGRLPAAIRVGVVLPLSGDGASVGRYVKNGMELAREEVNRYEFDASTLEFIVEDSESSASVAAEAFEKLIHEDRVSVILGPGYSSSAAAAFPIAQQNNVVAFSPTAAAAGLGAIGDFVFRVPAPVSRIAQSTLEVAAAKLNLKSVAVIYDSTDVFSRSGYEETVKALDELGIQSLAAEAFATGQTDFTAALARINDVRPDIILVWTRPMQRVAIPVQGRRLGIPYETPFLVFGFASSQIEPAGAAAEGLITGTFWSRSIATPGNRAFIENYRHKFGGDPDLFAAEGYVCVRILAAAVAAAGSITSESVRDALAAIEMPTVVGPFAFDANGDPTYPAVLQVVRDGRFETLGS